MPLLGNLIGNRLIRDVAIDLGTSNIVIYSQGRGILLREPSTVALRRKGTGDFRLLAVGEEARLMIGKGHRGVSVMQPLLGSVIADSDASIAMLRELLRMAGVHSRLSRLRVTVSMPLDSTAIERRAVQQAVIGAGAVEIQEIEQPVAAALGAGLPVHEPAASMVVDVGGGSTEAGIVSLGGIVIARSVRIGGNSMDESIQGFIRRRYNLLASLQECERVKMSIGTVDPQDEARAEVRGRGLASGLPEIVTVSSGDIRTAISEHIRTILDTIREVLEHCPPELSGELLENGLYLTGGASQIRGLDKLIGQEMNLSVRIADDPMSTVALGLGRVIDSSIH